MYKSLPSLILFSYIHYPDYDIQTSMVRFGILLLILFSMNGRAFSQTQEEFVCMPCGQACDKKVYDKPGRCSHCMMDRVRKSTITFEDIQPEELCDYIDKHPDLILLDVRSRKEFEGKTSPDYGTLKNAINIPIQELNSRLSELASHKGKTIIVYCSHSQRSSQGSYLLTQSGFNHVFNMAGGLSVMKDKACLK